MSDNSSILNILRGDAMPFGVGGPAEPAVGPPQFVVNGLNSAGTLPRRAIENSQHSLENGTYDPSTAVEAALLTMGATPFGAGEKTLGAGPVKGTLDMSQEARMARAAEQGYDTSKPLYHGTSKDVDFKTFNEKKNGIWTTDSPKDASYYAKDNDSQRMSYNPHTREFEDVNTASRVMPLYGKMSNPKIVEQWPDALRNSENYTKAQQVYFDQLKREGHDGVIGPGGSNVFFKGEQLRSQFAPFDPKNAGKNKILGAGPTDPTMLLLNALRGSSDE